MIKQLLFVLSVFVFFACDEEKKPTPTASPFVKVNMIEKKSRKCVRDTVCAEINLNYPILTGGDNTAAVNAINDSLHQLALTGLQTNPKLSVEPAFDSVQNGLLMMLQQQVKLSPKWGANFFKTLETRTLLNTPKNVSFKITATGFTGGAHPYYQATFVTYDLNTGKSVKLTDVVRDTSALRPMLEKGFLDAKKESPSDTLKLSDLLLPGITRLPVSTNVCVVPEGLLFCYNPYEVSAWAVGPTEITISWDQLASLADRKRWLE